jgi:RND family efflux transporter MFP subunit
MKQFFSKVWRPALGVLGLAAVGVYSTGSCRAKVEPGRVEFRPGIAIPAGAEIHTVSAETIASLIEVVGTVGSEENVHISSRLSAYVKSVAVSAGSVVKKGQTLVTLDDRELREQLAGADVQLRQAETEFKRATQLFDSKATTEQQLTAAKAAFDAARTQAERVKVMLTYAEIQSPLDGIVTDRRIEAGDMANPGQVLLAVYDPTRMRLEAPVPVRLVDKLGLNQEVKVKLERPERVYTGRVTQLVSEIDPLTRTQTVKIQLEGASNEVLPGAFGRLLLEETPRSAVLVPATAVARIGQLEMVQLVQGERVVRRLVKAGPARDGRIEILAGLNPGDRILAKSVVAAE